MYDETIYTKKETDELLYKLCENVDIKLLNLNDVEYERLKNIQWWWDRIYEQRNQEHLQLMAQIASRTRSDHLTFKQ